MAAAQPIYSTAVSGRRRAVTPPRHHRLGSPFAETRDVPSRGASAPSSRCRVSASRSRGGRGRVPVAHRFARKQPRLAMEVHGGEHGEGQGNNISLPKQLQAIWYYSDARSCSAAAWQMGSSCSDERPPSTESDHSEACRPPTTPRKSHQREVFF